MNTEFYAEYIKKTTFDPETSSVRSKFNTVKADDVEVGVEVSEKEQLEEAATDEKKKPASKTPKLEVPATEIPEELHGDQDKLDHNKDKKITSSDMKKVRKHGPVDTEEGFMDAVKGAVSSAGNAVSGSIAARKSKFGTSGGAKSASAMRSVYQSTEYDNEDGIMEGTFKVEVDGLPTMYMDGSAGEIKASLRKKFKDPKAVISVERITPAEKKKELRAKVAEEDLNELDKKTMSSYVKKAVNDLDNRSFTQGMRDNNPKYTSADAKNNAKIRARRAGIDRAVNKMSEDQAAIDAYLKKGGKITKGPPAKAQGAHGDTSMASGIAGQLSKADTSRFKTQKKIKSMEDVEQVDEISKRAKAAYTRVAARDLHHQGSKAAQGVANNDREAIKKADRNINNRLQGIDRATKSLQKEGAMKRMATQDAEKERLGPRKVKGDGLDTFKKKVEELSSDTLRSYRNKISKHGVDAVSKDKSGNFSMRKHDNRHSGEYLAHNKLAKSGHLGTTSKQAFKNKAKVGTTNEEKDTHVTKDGKTAKKGLWYNIHQKRKRGEAPAKPGDPDRPSAADLKRSQ